MQLPQAARFLNGQYVLKRYEGKGRDWWLVTTFKDGSVMASCAGVGPRASWSLRGALSDWRAIVGEGPDFERPAREGIVAKLEELCGMTAALAGSGSEPPVEDLSYPGWSLQFYRDGSIRVVADGVERSSPSPRAALQYWTRTYAPLPGTGRMREAIVSKIKELAA